MYAALDMRRRVRQPMTAQISRRWYRLPAPCSADPAFL